MRPFVVCRWYCLAALVTVLVACQGNIGTSPPMIAPAPMQPPAVPQANNQYGGALATRPAPVRTKLVFTSSTTTLDFPDTGGYHVSILLNGPTSAPTPVPSGTQVKTSAHGAHRKSGLPAASAAPSPIPSGTATPGTGFLSSLFSGAPFGSPATSASGGSPLPSASASPSGSTSGATGAPSSAPTSKPTGPVSIELATIPYPHSAPPAPTALPSASPPPSRHALLRAELQSQGALTISSLDALLFTLPATELFSGRGFAVLVLEQGKHKHETVLFSDPNATLDATSSTIHTTSGRGPIVMQANHRYAAILYGDDPAPTPPPISTSFPRPFGFGSATPAVMPSGIIVPTPAPVVPVVPNNANPGG